MAPPWALRGPKLRVLFRLSSPSASRSPASRRCSGAASWHHASASGSAVRSRSAPSCWRCRRSRPSPCARPRGARRSDRPSSGHRTAVLATLLGAALWVGSIGLMEVQSLALPPPPAYLEAFRAIHEAPQALGPAGRDRLPRRDRHSPSAGPVPRELVVARGPPVRRSSSGWAPGAPSSAPRSSSPRCTPIRTGSSSRWRSASCWACCACATGFAVATGLAHVTLNALTFAFAPLVADPSQPVHAPAALGLAWPRRRVRRRLAPAAGAGRETVPPPPRLIALPKSCILGG